MKDFLGQIITTNAPCVFLKNTRTGSSTTRKMLYKGRIAGFTSKMVKVKDETGAIHTVWAEDIVQTVRVFDDSVIASVMLPNGQIEARISNDFEYPGIDVEFVANDDNGETPSRPRMLMEQPKGENVRVLIWENPNNEDYTFEHTYNGTYPKKEVTD